MDHASPRALHGNSRQSSMSPRLSSSCLRSHFPTWLRLWSNQTVMRGPRGIRSGQHFSLWSHEAGFSSWRARSAAISCRSPPQLWSGDKKYASSASSREYILFDGLAPRLSHVSHVIPEPEPESRYGHANYGPGERGLQRAARQGRSYEQHGITLALCLWY